MEAAGFTVFDLDGGMLAWTKARKPVVSEKEKSVKAAGSPVEQIVANSIANDTLIEQVQDFLLCKGNRETLVTLSKMELKDRKKRISEIKTSTLVLWGSKAEMVNFEKDLPNVRFKSYQGIGLLPMIELPEKMANDVVQFLNRYHTFVAKIVIVVFGAL